MKGKWGVISFQVAYNDLVAECVYGTALDDELRFRYRTVPDEELNALLQPIMDYILTRLPKLEEKE